MKKTIVVVAGPTAVGKTDLAIQVAEYFKTSILSADSRQCYRELNIGVAKPLAEQLAAVHHYFIDSHSIQQAVDASSFELYALKSLDEIFSTKNIAVVAGGTGLYIKALCEGLDVMPTIPEDIRESVRDGYYENGMQWLQSEVEKLDPVFYETGEIKNPHRMMRALEFVRTTGESIKTYQRNTPKTRSFDIIKIGLDLPREVLNERVNMRVEKMMKDGLAGEVKSLLAFQELKALQTVGYSELFDHFNGLSSLSAAVEFIKRNTRQYAKRQMTWFKKDAEMTWFRPDEPEAILSFVRKRLALE